MKFLVYFFLILGVVNTFAQKQIENPKLFSNGEKSVCFVGDSITHHGYYPKHIALYYVTRYPYLQKDFLNAGFEGGSANTTNLRLKADIAPKNAQIHTVMLGMNDVRHGNFSKKALADKEKHEAKKIENFEIYKRNMTKLVDSLQEKGKVVLLSSSIYDGIGDILDPYAVMRNGEIIHLKRSKGLQYVNDELNRYGQWCAKLAKERNLLFADLWRETNLANIKVVKENQHSSAIGRNRVHPFDFGGFFTAYAFLKDLGESNVVSTVSIDAQTCNSEFINAIVLNVSKKWLNIPLLEKKYELTFDIEEYALPYPLTENTYACTKYCNFSKDLNQQMLIVKNLPQGEYQLKIDEKIVGFYTHKQLQNGVNLGENILTPQAKQALLVEHQLEIWRERTQRVRDLFGTEFIMGVYNDDNTPEQNIKIAKIWIDKNKVSKASRNSFLWYVQNRNNKDKFQQQANDALKKAYELAKPKLHKYSLSKIFKEIYVSEKNTKPETPNNINIVKDIKYSDVSNRTLDLFLPKDKKISHPCVILFHGGGWISGKKTNMQPMAEYLASVGYAVVNVEYALKKQFNEALKDQFRVLKWIENNADKYKINLDKIATCGGSSGGVMAMQLATIANNIDAFNKTINKTDLKPKSVKPISACITMASGHDMTHPRRFNKMFACDTPKARNYSSYTYLSKNNPPTLLTHGMFDNVVTSSETLKISEALQQNGIETQVILYNTKIHAYWQLNGGKLMQKVWTDVQNFLDKTFKQ